LIAVSTHYRIEAPRPLHENRPGDSYHFGIELTIGGGELWCPNLGCGAQREQRHPVPRGSTMTIPRAGPEGGQAQERLPRPSPR
jgi:hypothetical protein